MGSYFLPVTSPGSSYRPPLGRGWFTLAHALAVVLTLTIATYVLNAGFSLWAWRTLRGWADDPTSIDRGTAELYDAVVAPVAVTLGVLHLVILVLFIVWLFRAHRSDRMEPLHLEHRSGWAIGGWFVPILNLYRPFQMVEDVQRGCRSWGDAPSRVTVWWWLSLLAASIADRVTTALVPDEDGTDTLAALANANLSDTIASLIWLLAALLAVLVVRGTTELVRRSPHVPHAPAQPAGPTPVH